MAAGKSSHDLGHYTDKCNLHTGQSSILNSVSGYIDDPGAKNRNERGHRRWCLNPTMGVTGFGKSADKKYFAMWAMDHSANGVREGTIWSYPGRGLFPIKYLHGSGWSLYLTESAPPVGSLKVEVYRLVTRPEKPFGTGEIPGEELPVPHVSTYLNGINFEPTGAAIKKPGLYYVRIRGTGLREQYVVELIDL
jgi:hypothetical protein